MMITVNELDQRVVDAAAAREKMEREKKDRAAKKEALAQEAEAYAEANDVDGYLRCKQQIERLDAIDHVIDVQLRKSPQIASNDEIRAAWNDYASEYNRKMVAGLASLEKTRKELLRVYGELYEAQKSALAIRGRLEQYAADEHVLDSATPMEFIGYVGGYDPHAIRPNYGSDPNCAYFLASVVNNHTEDAWKVAETLAVIQRHTLSNL